ncbi:MULTISPECIES: flagellar protein FlaG [Cohnella]|jgi:flagellar protein FlaG|uniref:flagellar protein FlaG n=1 Tax=Cohnella TaxID=329857 RepID=UPI00036AD959|nr:MULTISPECIES: flagellar protein FlaG [Cohnella]REK66467.1 MAG: flagellar protein [Cohnella sp.]
MSGVQPADGISAFELHTARSASQETFKSIESAKKQGEDWTVDNKKENKFDFKSLSDEDKERLEKELKKVNESLVPYEKQIRFRYNEEAKQTYVEVIDLESQEVVASMPPEFLIDLSIKMRDMIGLFMDKKL